jgi:hypothetical protein
MIKRSNLQTRRVNSVLILTFSAQIKIPDQNHRNYDKAIYKRCNKIRRALLKESLKTFCLIFFCRIFLRLKKLKKDLMFITSADATPDY